MTKKIINTAPSGEMPVWKEVSEALTTQQGGDHYKQLKVQPVEYIHANKLGYMEGNVVKYVTRHANKNGAEDLKKAIHYCELLLELEYGKSISKEEGLRKLESREHRESQSSTEPSKGPDRFGRYQADN
tara:strand:+ start:216 stop:602 length:387 start_codon:yes stop_codon:yes gene_type:complete